MNTVSKKPGARVLWRRNGRLGHVSIYSEHLDEDRAVHLCQTIVTRASDEWVTLPGMATIIIQQPDPKWCGGAAEIETIDSKLKFVRDVAKATLRDAGYTVR